MSLRVQLHTLNTLTVCKVVYEFQVLRHPTPYESQVHLHRGFGTKNRSDTLGSQYHNGRTNTHWAGKNTVNTCYKIVQNYYFGYFFF